ncbi:hypothetical protein [Saccharothrix obliqua]|uniref:hypothetical protein n=1 Tax=Saccharothrix obliqua TaxID=2861747 RepID=UPI001C5CD4C0|nr:hypothetical protein [Saccharothrix obliqua]MBW4719694.1 hypothetical protein [Saccharothrix obliqua]
MDRRRVIVLAAAVVLFGGVVAVLRTTGVDDPSSRATTTPPPPTSLAPFAAPGVLAPPPGQPPRPPADLRVTPGPRRLQVAWTDDAPGHEVRWGRAGEPDRTRLVVGAATQLDGLADDVAHHVEVRAVDAFGQRSEPVRVEGTPRATRLDGYALVDAFDQPDAPDPARWRLTSRPNCARARPDDARRLVVDGGCAAPVTLRSRTPFVPHEGDVLGRFAVDTDAPGPDGGLDLDLVPGPVSVVGDVLPPGAIRLRVATGGGHATAEVVTADGVPTAAVRPVPPLEPGLTHRWELVLRRDGTRVLLDGELLATSPAVPRWAEATALVSVSGPPGRRVAVSLVAFDATPATPPPVTAAPPVRVTVAADAPPATGTPLPGVAGARLRLALLHADPSPAPPEFTLAAGGQRVPLRPAAADAPWRPGVAYPLVADLPADALVTSGDHLAMTVLTTVRAQVTHVDLEPAPAPGAPVVRPPAPAPPPAPVPVLPRVDATVLDAAGQPVPAGAPVKRGRLVLDLVLDGRSAQLGPGPAGLAGFTVRLDEERVAAVPTALGGPGVAGSYRLALDTSGLSFGPHMIEVKLFGTAADVRPTTAFVSFFVG